MSNPVKDHFQGNYSAFYEKYLPDLQKIGGDEYKATCPFHDDHKPSLNINNQSGKFYCHGCGKKGDAIHFYAKINSLDTRRDFRKILKGICSDFNIPFEEMQRRIVKTYDYTDAQGQLIHQTLRYEPKDFKQRHRANGKWVWNLKNVEPVLYRLPEVLKAKQVLSLKAKRILTISWPWALPLRLALWGPRSGDLSTMNPSRASTLF